MSAVIFPAELRAAAFDVAEAALRADVGNVSILKFLGGSDESEAVARWFTAIEAFVAVLPVGVFERLDLSSGRPVLQLVGGVRLEIDLYDLTARPHVDDAWRAAMRPGLAPLAIDAVAVALEPGRWGRAVDAAPSTGEFPVIEGIEPFGRWHRAVSAELAAAGDEVRARGWLIRAGQGYAPYPWYTDEVRARRAAAVFSLGGEGSARLFDEVCGGAR